ncbi:hypothetical protein F4680DRAFT_102046 [Xylaria scruposa]|nr:hypothetical protein F4680DRAFT_102046 [Xylaria scruposa]
MQTTSPKEARGARALLRSFTTLPSEKRLVLFRESRERERDVTEAEGKMPPMQCLHQERYEALRFDDSCDVSSHNARICLPRLCERATVEFSGKAQRIFLIKPLTNCTFPTMRSTFSCLFPPNTTDYRRTVNCRASSRWVAKSWCRFFCWRTATTNSQTGAAIEGQVRRLKLNVERHVEVSFGSPLLVGNRAMMALLLWRCVGIGVYEARSKSDRLLMR